MATLNPIRPITISRKDDSVPFSVPDELLEKVLAHIDCRHQHRIRRVNRRWQALLRRYNAMIINQDTSASKPGHSNSFCNFIVSQKSRVHKIIIHGSSKFRVRCQSSQTLTDKEKEAQLARDEADEDFGYIIQDVLMRVASTPFDDSVTWTLFILIMNIAIVCHSSFFNAVCATRLKVGSPIMLRNIDITTGWSHWANLAGSVSGTAGGILELKTLFDVAGRMEITLTGDHVMRCLSLVERAQFLAAAKTLQTEIDWTDEDEVFGYFPVDKSGTKDTIEVMVFDDDGHRTVMQLAFAALFFRLNI